MRYSWWDPRLEQTVVPPEEVNGIQEKRFADMERVHGSCCLARVEPIPKPELIPAGEDEFQAIEDINQLKL